jgi:hypothetical protein
VPLPPVVVEISPRDAPVEHRQSLVEACSHAVENATCVESTATESTEPLVVAVVTWKDTEHVRIEVSLRLEKRASVRDVTFSTRDAVEERWRAAGLVVGTLATVMAKHDEPVASPEAVPDPQQPQEAEPVFDESGTGEPSDDATKGTGNDAGNRVGPRRGSVDAAAILGSALNDGTVRVGGEVDARGLILRPGVFLSGGVAYSESATRPHSVKTSYAEVLLGLALEHDFSAHFGAVLLAEGSCQRFEASVGGAGDAAPTSGTRVLGGARLGAELVYRATNALGFFVGGSGLWTAGTTEIDVAGANAGTASPLGYVARAGVTYGIP